VVPEAALKQKVDDEDAVDDAVDEETDAVGEEVNDLAEQERSPRTCLNRRTSRNNIED
jgi:hypothetical protein